MKSRKPLALTVNTVCSFMLMASPLVAVAEEGTQPPPVDSVIITEIQTGAASASDEFVELYNPTDETVDITDWQVRYVNAGNTTTTPLATIVSPDAQPVVLGPGSYYTIRTVSLPVIGVGQTYNATLAKTDKTVALFAADPETCQLIVIDAVAWALPTASATQGEGLALDSTAVNTKEKLVQRVRDTLGNYVDTNNNNFDFTLSTSVASASAPAVGNTATPGAHNSVFLQEGAVIPVGGLASALASLSIDGCVVPPDEPETDPEDPTLPPPGDSPPSVIEPPEETPDDEQDPTPFIPASNFGLKAPLLSEFLPNPGSPQTDKADEFIELYNPNDAYFDLSGYFFEVGLKTKKVFTIPAGTKIAPKKFMAFFSADTKLALSNSGSQVVFVDPLGKTLGVSDAYGTAKDNYAWVLSGGVWQWTTKPTPNAINSISAPPIKASGSKKKTVAGARTGATTGANGTSGGASSEGDVQQAAAVASTSGTPVHPGVLALIAVSAVLYGAYEYRRDVANKIHQFRSNRAARRALRQSSQGR